MPEHPTVARITDGTRLADIRRSAPTRPEPYRSDYAFLLGEIDRLTDLLEQAQIEAKAAIGGAA